MKISKILAGLSAAAIAASMVAIPASAASSTEYLFTVQTSWTGAAAADSEKGQVKFTDNTAKGATDLNAWDSGSVTYNGNWVQYLLTSDDISSLSMEFTVQTTADTRWEYHIFDEGETPDQYEVLRVFDASICDYFTDYENITAPDGTANKELAGVYENTFTYQIDSATIQTALDAGKAQLAENGDGTYTLGFSFQVGHYINGLVTGTVTGDNLYQGADDSTNSTDDSTTDSTNSTASTTDSTSSDGKVAGSNTSSTTGTSSTKSASTTKTTTSTGSGTASTASDNTSNANSGAAAGVGLAVAALAGAAIVVSRKK
jgi:hypothetical protein